VRLMDDWCVVSQIDICFFLIIYLYPSYFCVDDLQFLWICYTKLLDMYVSLH